MKKLFILTLTIGILSLILYPAQADCVVRSRVIVNPVVSNNIITTNHAAVVVKKEVALATVVPVGVYQAIPLYIPTYAASYQPGYPVPPVVGGSPPPPAAPGADFRAVMEALDRINRRLDALEGKPPPPINPAVPPPPSTPVVPPPNKPKDPFNPEKGNTTATPENKGNIRVPTVIMNKCSQCHQKGKEKDGGDFVIVEGDGTLAKLTDKQILGITRRSYSGTMPPKSSKIEALTDEEVGQIIEFFDPKK